MTPEQDELLERFTLAQLDATNTALQGVIRLLYSSIADEDFKQLILEVNNKFVEESRQLITNILEDVAN